MMKNKSLYMIGKQRGWIMGAEEHLNCSSSKLRIGFSFFGFATYILFSPWRDLSLLQKYDEVKDQLIKSYSYFNFIILQVNDSENYFCSYYKSLYLHKSFAWRSFRSRKKSHNNSIVISLMRLIWIQLGRFDLNDLRNLFWYLTKFLVKFSCTSIVEMSKLVYCYAKLPNYPADKLLRQHRKFWLWVRKFVSFVRREEDETRHLFLRNMMLHREIYDGSFSRRLFAFSNFQWA